VHTLVVALADAAPEYAVPAAEVAREYTREAVPVAAEAVAAEAPAELPPAAAVPAPALPAGYVPDELTEQARRIFREDFPPSVRKIRERFSVGQARAQRIRDELTAGATA
jgi:hypothetical protein